MPPRGSLEIAVWSHGRGLTWGPTVQQLHKVGWEGSQPPVLLSQPPAVLNLGRGKDAGVLPQVSLEILNPPFCRRACSSPCSLSFPSLRLSSLPTPPPSLHPNPLTRAPSSLPNPLISFPHLLYHFHNLPSLQLQLVCLLRVVVEVHFAPSLRAPRFSGVTWFGHEEVSLSRVPQ